MLRTLPLPILAAALTLAACGPSNEARAPRPGDTNALAKATVHALEVEATRPAAEALDAWLAVLAEAREVTGTPLSREAALAAIDVLTGREVFGLGALGIDVGLAQRVPGGPAKVEAALDATLTSPGAADPMLRAYATDAKTRFALARGDAAGVAAARKASGCVTEATVVGPWPGAVLGPLADPGPVDAGTIAASYPASSPLALAPKAQKSWGRGCSIDVTGAAEAAGLRYVAFDVDVPEAQTITIGVDSALPAHVLVSGKRVLSLPYGEVLKRATRFGKVEVKSQGAVRVVVKLGAYSNQSIGLYAYAQDGSPLVTRASGVSAPPSTPIGAVGPEPKPALPSTVEGRVTWSLGALASGDVRLAEGAIAEVARPSTATSADDPKHRPHPAAALVYARTLVHARDIPFHRRLERQRAAIESVLAAWPTSWEAIVAHASIVSLQRQGGAGDVDAIADARTRRDKGAGKVDPLVDAYLALIGDGIYGVREDSLARVKPRLDKTWVGHRLDRATAKETDDVAAKRACDPARPDLGRFDCASALFSLGDHKGVLAEVARLRALYDAPRLATDWEISSTLKVSGPAAAKALYDAADPADRSLRTAVSLVPPGAAGLDWLRREIRTLGGDTRWYRDVVALRRAAGDASVTPPPSLAYDAKAKTLVAGDRKSPVMPAAGTVILAREEKYDLAPDGFLHATVWDVRRLSGTQDVDANASAQVAGTSSGTGWMGRSIHRIHKADGTIVEPDRIAAAQAGAELSQIEPGDYVELVSEGWFLPRADGTFDLDTPDLLPARTAVASASITLSTPSGVTLDVWSHPALGQASLSATGGKKVATWSVADHDVRRTEKGQAPIDRDVAVRLGTWTWERLGRDARENVLADEERLPEVSAWVAQATGKDKAPTLDLLVRLAKASKQAIPRVGLLPLGVGGLGAAQTYTARTVLLDAQGSRVALVHRALDELGVKNEIVWAESAPYSADPKMVARPYRFAAPPHALLVAWVAKEPGGTPEPWWLDLDVDGMPPPPGRTSPELRGRSAITTKGEVIPVPPNAAEEPDVATIDLSVDETGKAHGTLSVLLRGRDAQDLSAVLEELAGEEREDTLRAYVLAWMPNADVTDVKASAETWQILLSAKLEVPNLLVPDGARLAIAGTPPLHSGARATTLGQSYAAQAKRTTALAIHNATQYAIHRVIRLPKGTSISTPLPAVDVHDKATSLHATRKVKVDGSTIVEDFTFSLPTGVVPVNAFDAFTAVARTVDDGFLSVVRVMPPAGSSMGKPIAEAKPALKTPEKPTVAKPAVKPASAKP